MVVQYTRAEIASLATRLHVRGTSRLATPMAAKEWPSHRYDLRAASAMLRKWLAYDHFDAVSVEVENDQR